mgnify:FL=1
MSAGRYFARRVSAFLAETDMPPSMFGRRAVSDPAFVSQLRNGREPREQTIARVDAFMAKVRREREGGAA